MIQLKEYDIKLDIKTKEVKYYDSISKKEIKEIEVVRSDYKTNRLNISLISGNQPYIIGDNTVEIAFKKYDNTIVLMEYTDENLVVEDNTIKVLLTTNITAISGRQVIGEVIVKGINGEILTSRANFYFRVHRGVLTDEAIASTNELPLLNRLIDQVDTLDNTLTDNEVIRGQVFNSIMDTANTTKTGLDAGIIQGQTTNNNLDDSIEIGDILKNSLDTLVVNGNKTTDSLQNTIDDSIAKKSALDDSITTSITKKSELDDSIGEGNAIHNTLSNVTNGTIKIATDIDVALKSTIDNASESKINLDESINLSNTKKTALDDSISLGDTTKSDIGNSVSIANTSKSELDKSISEANIIENTLSNIETGTIKLASDANQSLQNEIDDANTFKVGLDQSVQDGINAKNALELAMQNGGVIYENVDILKDLRIYKGVVEPMDTSFWYDTSDNIGITRV